MVPTTTKAGNTRRHTETSNAELAVAKLNQDTVPEYSRAVHFADLAKPESHPDLADDGVGAAA